MAAILPAASIDLRHLPLTNASGDFGRPLLGGNIFHVAEIRVSPRQICVEPPVSAVM